MKKYNTYEIGNDKLAGVDYGYGELNQTEPETEMT